MVINPPPPTPVIARNAISCAAVFETDDASDPIKNINRPVRRTNLRDQISENLPYRSWKDVDVLDPVSDTLISFYHI